MVAPQKIAGTTAIGLVGAQPELGACVSGAMAAIKGCELVQPEDQFEAANLIHHDSALGLLLVFVADAAGKEAAQELIRLAQARKPAVPVVVLAEAALAADTAEFLSWGAADSLLRPLNLSRLTFLIDFLTLRMRTCAGQANSAFPSFAEAAKNACPGGLIFPSEAGQRLYATAVKLARVDTTVLLQGETGSGKTCVARLIHESSPRKGKPFVVVNCGSLPESLLEGELFGHRQGAYTGADRNHRGKFAQAADGTIFLDEIDSLPLKAQSSLLRVVEDRHFEPLGSERTEKLHARLLFATNRDLAGEVQAGRFRADLYYRMNVVALTVPTLRARKEAIPILVDVFLKDLRSKRVTEVKGFSHDALAAMDRYSWPGNLRELRNIVERAAVLSDREIVTASELPAEIFAPMDNLDAVVEVNVQVPTTDISAGHLNGARRMAERQLIVRTLESCAQNRSLTAQTLGISRAALYKKLRQLQIA